MPRQSTKAPTGIGKLIAKAIGAFRRHDPEFLLAPVILAAQRGQHETVELLLNNAVNVDSADAEGWTALMAAAAGGSIKTVEVLDRYNCQVDLCTSTGLTALTIAAASGNTAIAKILLKRPGDALRIRLTSATDTKGALPLTVAAECGHRDMVILLLQSHLDSAQSENEEEELTTVFLGIKNFLSPNKPDQKLDSDDFNARKKFLKLAKIDTENSSQLVSRVVSSLVRYEDDVVAIRNHKHSSLNISEEIRTQTRNVVTSFYERLKTLLASQQYSALSSNLLHDSDDNTRYISKLLENLAELHLAASLLNKNSEFEIDFSRCWEESIIGLPFHALQKFCTQFYSYYAIAAPDSSAASVCELTGNFLSIECIRMLKEDLSLVAATGNNKLQHILKKFNVLTHFDQYIIADRFRQIALQTESQIKAEEAGLVEKRSIEILSSLPHEALYAAFRQSTLLIPKPESGPEIAPVATENNPDDYMASGDLETIFTEHRKVAAVAFIRLIVRTCQSCISRECRHKLNLLRESLHTPLDYLAVVDKLFTISKEKTFFDYEMFEEELSGYAGFEQAGTLLGVIENELSGWQFSAREEHSLLWVREISRFLSAIQKRIPGGQHAIVFRRIVKMTTSLEPHVIAATILSDAADRQNRPDSESKSRFPEPVLQRMKERILSEFGLN